MKAPVHLTAGEPIGPTENDPPKALMNQVSLVGNITDDFGSSSVALTRCDLGRGTCGGSLGWLSRFSPARSQPPQEEVVGMRVFVAGKLVQRNWQDNDGCSTLDRFLRTAISGGGSGFAREGKTVKCL
jgi:hypothetical protein